MGQKRGKNKRGISNVIATLLLVLLVIVIIGVVWVLVRNVVSSAGQGITLGGITLDLKITRASKGVNNLSVTVQRQPGQGDITGVNFVVSDGITYETIKQNSVLDVYQGKTFTVIPTQMFVGSIKTVSVAPVFNANGAQQVGSITDTYTFGASQVSGDMCSSAADPTFNGLCGNLGYNCGDVNNGTCTPVSCGSCGPLEFCNLQTHRCTSSGGSSCSPAPDPSFAALCTNNGFECGDVNNGTCNLVNCGPCGDNQHCDLVTHRCSDNFNPQPCKPKTTCLPEYQCGDAPDGCGTGTLNCGPCNPGSFCNNDWQCEAYKMSNVGKVFSAWPPAAPTFLDSPDLPTSQTDIVSYNDGQHYIRFNGTAISNQCFQVALLAPENPPSLVSYVRLSDSAAISAGNSYQIWNDQIGCSLHVGYN